MLATDTIPATFETFDGITVSDATYQDLGLHCLGSGVSRTTFALSDRYVLKVCDSNHSGAGNNLSEVAVYLRAQSEGWDDILTVIVAASPSGAWIVAERLCCVSAEVCAEHDDNYQAGSEVCAIAQENGVRDLHGYNWGFRYDGTAAILDYAFSHADMEDCDCERSTTSTPRCECGDCDCGDCFPNGCYCETLQGCRATRCSACSCSAQWNAAETFRPLGSMFGARPCSLHRVCRDCANKGDNKGKPEPIAQCEGQRAMFAGHWWSRGNLWVEGYHWNVCEQLGMTYGGSVLAPHLAADSLVPILNQLAMQLSD